MDISSLGGVASAYSYANQIRNKQVSSSGFANSLNEATAAENKVEAYKNSLQEKYGVPIMVTSVGKDQNSMDRFAGGTSGSGNVAIAPNILEQMANDPEKAAYYEKKISDYFNYGVPKTDAFMAMIGHRKTSEGLVIHEDGTVTHYLSGEESPEKIAKFEAEQKAKREKKAKQAQENMERSQKAAEERRRTEAENLRRRSIEAVLNEQMLGSGIFAFGDTPESVLTAYGAGISISDNSDF